MKLSSKVAYTLVGAIGLTLYYKREIDRWWHVNVRN